MSENTSRSRARNSGFQRVVESNKGFLIKISHGNAYDEASSPVVNCNCSASGTEICLDVDTKPQVYAPQGAPHIMCDAVIQMKPPTGTAGRVHGTWLLAAAANYFEP
ncbi:hypothetical protein ASPBRDRAFT_32136 [Aspergillus brasiliensis CBS 101740]|uniref:Uncharacterized protein n=1 Tax=Aspergillus brasiliensis (strain CBS 101740 / IMI 381727 / IBT 21946) TaxID=767769 RepID=A0A1L9UCD0_ASPBC|nr:hypothetical protein ASPBRDRAFT_32136 [Aspergillus brasiliensis CBS 101740]